MHGWSMHLLEHEFGGTCILGIFILEHAFLNIHVSDKMQFSLDLAASSTAVGAALCELLGESTCLNIWLYFVLQFLRLHLIC